MPSITPILPVSPNTVFNAHTQAPALWQRLQQTPDALLVACYCATWCKTCEGYRRDFDRLAAQWPRCVFTWVDIETCPQLLGDEDVENFPTLLLQERETTLFFGVQQPFIRHLEALLQRSSRLTPVQAAPPLRTRLLREMVGGTRFKPVGTPHKSDAAYSPKAETTPDARTMR